MHNISNINEDTSAFFENPWSSKYNNIVVRKAKEIILHPENSYNNINDFGILILEIPVKFSHTIGPVCLPLPEDYSVLEEEENILTGYGMNKLWFNEYERLLGKPLPRANLLPKNIAESRNKSVFIDIIKEKGGGAPGHIHTRLSDSTSTLCSLF